MTDSWTKIFELTIDGRSVTGMRYDEGDVKVETAQKGDVDSHLSWPGHGVAIVDSTESGRLIEIHGKTLGELGKNLITDGSFTEEEAERIIQAFE